MKKGLSVLAALSVLAVAPFSSASAQGIDWSTFFGGDDWDSSSLYHGIATFPNGDVLLAGGTMSEDFPTTPGAYQEDWAGGTGLNIGDAFLARVSADGSTIVWSTLFGGSADEMATDVAIGSNGLIYIVGWSNSTDLDTTPGAYQVSSNGGIHLGPDESFAACFDPSKTGQDQLVWCTYLGAERNDIAFAVDVDVNGNVFLGGWTESLLFPVEGNPYQDRRRGMRDFFITKLTPDGSDAIASTYLGGARQDELYSLALDSRGNPVVCGRTRWVPTPTAARKNHAPVSPGAYQSTYGGGERDTYVAKLNSNLSRLLYGTLLGGSDYDGGSALAIDSQDRIIVHGWTTSPDHPVSAGAFQPDHSGNVDAAISMLDPRKIGPNQLIWSTYLGGIMGEEYPNGLVVSPNGHVTVCGTTGSADFPTTANGFDPTWNGGFWDGFVTRFNPEKQGRDQLVYSTFVGDERVDISYAITRTPSDDIVVTGRTDSPNFPLMNPIQGSLGGEFDSYLMLLDLPSSVLPQGR